MDASQNASGVKAPGVSWQRSVNILRRRRLSMRPRRVRNLDISVGDDLEMAIRARWIRFLDVESRVVWSAPADMRA